MRIAFLCKRHYTGKDVIRDRYGRLYELPHQLTKMGHEVRAWCLDYRGQHDERWQCAIGSGTMTWTSIATKGINAARLAVYPYRLRKQLENFEADLIIGASDIPHVALSAWLGRQLEVPCVVDLYDNFESFGQARIPGFHALLKYAIRNASLLITVSQALRAKVQRDHSPTCPILVMPNGINTTIFSPGGRKEARIALELPTAAKLIGTAGGLSRMKGLDTVYTAWQQMEHVHPDLHLVLAGPLEKGFPPPAGSRVHYLGNLPETQVAEIFRALDVGIICLKDSPFGRYCFPQKAHEMLACDLPVVVTSVGDMSSLFASWPSILFPADNPQALSAALLKQLNQPVVPAVPVLDWQQLVSQVEPTLARLACPK